MAQRTLQVVLPEETYLHMERLAAQSNQSVGQLAAAILHRYIYPGDNIHPLPSASELDLERLATFTDEQLWGVAYHRVPAYQELEYHDLIEKRKSEPLTDQEEEHLTSVVEKFDKSMLLRSQALMLLHQRGHDVRAFFAPISELR